ncbi:DUF808 domain-containing protein [Brucella anthropi]|uniref:DUF808 domain-containing protein n=1 Tax=Brucella/Ochrobactrum group TaxID=2826938 RepID=UPI00124CEB18|nr:MULTISPECIES: DUF808 domain-containing protein [Brucella/Ochrobactrum group]KAB2765350.1 DUF808 domain-containing protein [Brucella anthropi]KAB2781986.1 DUF808 domain-containing protein [Brucella anthropi]MCQ9143933.1 DUF808 domain-containing protein [Ochrobactrum sp. BTU2]UGQ22789.1 DUF808 domain-containing protein [Brucella anthropi]
MASGLFALLDDVAAIAKMAAASLDDVAGQTAKASAKAAGIVIDDTAVTPKYVVGLKPERELPVIWKITKGSLRNKLIVLLPLALILGYFAPSFIMPLLMIGGVYLAFEGTEKLVEFFIPHKEEEHEETKGTTAKEIEETTVSGAIRTDFILSAEIMALTLAGLAPSNIYTQAAILAAVGILITFAVYGVVGIIVKLDDMGVSLVRNSHTAFGRQLGKGLVAGMPIILKVLSTVGTIAMLWVGGSIIVHGLDSIGIHSVEAFIHSIVSHLPTEGTRFSAAFEWIATSFLQAVLAVLIGIVVVIAVNVFKALKAKA